MLLSQICHPSVTTAAPCYSGVQVDCTNPSLPPGLVVIGLRLVQSPPPGQVIGDDDLDAVLSLCIQGVEVVIEIPFAQRHIHELNRWMQFAANAGVSLSLLPPPKLDSSGRWPEYAGWIAETTREYLDNTAFTGLVYPITNHIQYLFRQALLGENTDTRITPSDPYTPLAFAALPDGLVARWKEAVQKELYTTLGGADGVRRHAEQSVQSLWKQILKRQRPR